MRFPQQILNLTAAMLCLWSTISIAQFNNTTDVIGNHYVSTTTSFGSGISFCDFDNDGWDDLSFGLGMHPPKFFKNIQGSFVPVDFNIATASSSNVIMMLWADYDNDGDKDLLITKHIGAVELWQNDGNFNFTNVALDAGIVTGSYFHAGAAFADFNHDGCLDLYITKYYDQANLQTLENHTNILYKNNCDGTFTDVTEQAGVFLLPTLTFQPVFFDYNKDGWEDLYLINEFGHYQNHLFRNNTDGTFTDVSEQTGAGINIEAMSGTIGDFNNDLHLDIFVTNRPSTGGNNLLVDQGDGTFLNLAEDLGLGINYTSWGALWLDYNNNGWQDLFVTIPAVGISGQDGNQFYINNQGNSFLEGRDQLGFSEDFTPTYVCARGDIHNDGFYDLTHSSLYNDPVHLYENIGGAHNYISVELEGTLSNRDGIGSWIYCYADTMTTVHYTMCGENLIGQNSRKMIFGLAELTNVDSLVIEWNSGTREVYYHPEINTQHYFVEGASLTQPIAIDYSANTTLCPNDSLLLNSTINQSYLWNTGDTTQSITVHESGLYYLTAWNEFGLPAYSDTVQVVVVPEAEVSFNTHAVSCPGGHDGSIEVLVSTGPLQEIVWNTGAQDTLLTELSEGLYSFAGLDSAGCEVEGTVYISQSPPFQHQVTTTDVECFGDSTGSVEIAIVGGTPPYEYNWNTSDPNMVAAGTYQATVTDQNGCIVTLPYIIEEPDSLWAELFINPATDEANGSATAAISGGTPPYEILWSNGAENVDALTDLTPGDYDIFITDFNGCSWSQSFVVEQVSAIGVLSHHGLKIFPNPAGDYVQIFGCTGQWEFVLHNLTGETVSPRTVGNCPMRLNVAHLAAGTYILQMTSAGEHVVQRVMVGR